MEALEGQMIAENLKSSDNHKLILMDKCCQKSHSPTSRIVHVNNSMLLIPVKSSIHTLAFMNFSDLRFDSSSPAKPNVLIGLPLNTGGMYSIRVMTGDQSVICVS
ncbi:hypothetical protein OXX79_010471 [Metschnikowia pulcherrima]